MLHYVGVSTDAMDAIGLLNVEHLPRTPVYATLIILPIADSAINTAVATAAVSDIFPSGIVVALKYCDGS